jgi:phage FluMu gp28-like protein
MFFLPYQRAWIKDPSRLKLLEKSRQIGMTWASAYALVRRQADPAARLDAWVSSRDAVQARLFLDDARAFARILDRAACTYSSGRPPAGHSPHSADQQNVQENARANAVLPDPPRANAHTLHFANRTRLHSLSSNPDAQAGKRGPRLLDEFALHPDPKKLYAIAYPGITWGGQLEILSTHRGAHNYFNYLVTEARHAGNPKGFSLHRVTLQDALDQGLLPKLQAKLPADDPRRAFDNAAYFDFIRASCPDHETFLQEYMCLPADESAAFLPWDLLAACEYSESEYIPLDFLPPSSAKISFASISPPTSLAPNSSSPASSRAAATGDLYLGVDIGRLHDLTVFWLFEKTGGVHLTRDVCVLEKQPFAIQEELLWQRLALPNLRRACLDATGLGRQLAERAQARFGARRVEAVTFTPAVKEELAYPLRAAFERRALRIPAEKLIRADLRAIKKTVTTSGNLRFAADRGPGGHADRFWALALALHAARSHAYPTSHYENLPRSHATPSEPSTVSSNTPSSASPHTFAV